MMNKQLTLEELIEILELEEDTRLPVPNTFNED